MTDLDTMPGGPATIVQVECKRCGGRWFPRTPEPPKRCARCGSPYWDRVARKRKEDGS